ncbi:hypothetical protein J32TS6_15380 [Virgibacillus pantothenticus]|nr:hypothetical protein J32TS6_15380 [Virgibacillus pantothenticus]
MRPYLIVGRISKVASLLSDEAERGYCWKCGIVHNKKVTLSMYLCLVLLTYINILGTPYYREYLRSQVNNEKKWETQ